MLMNKYKVFNILCHKDFYWYLVPTSQPFTFFDSEHPKFLTDTPEKLAIKNDFCTAAKDFVGFEENILERIAKDDPEKEFLIFMLFSYCEMHKCLSVLYRLYPYVKDDTYWLLSYYLVLSMIEMDNNPDIIPQSLRNAQNIWGPMDKRELYDYVMSEPDTGINIKWEDFNYSANYLFTPKKVEYEEVL